MTSQTNVQTMPQPSTTDGIIDFLSQNQTVTLAICVLALSITALIIAKANFKYVKSFCLVSTNSFANLILHISGVIWASSVSIYNAQLQAQIVSHSAPIDSIGTIFLFANGVAVLLLTSRYRGESLKNELEKSLPPTQVIEKGSDLHIKNLKLYEQALDTEQKLKIKRQLFNDDASFEKDQNEAINIAEQSIIKIISSIAEIANHWTKERHGNVHYSVNLFSVISTADYVSDPELDSALEASPFFLFTDTKESRLSFCDKLLIAQQSFSTTPSRGTPLVMPYSDLGTKQKYHPNFEGAPTAIEKSEARYVADTKKVADAFFARIASTHHGEFLTEKYKKDVRTYYKSDSTRSFLSIPLYNKDAEIIAVLNIYSRTKDMLSSEKRAEAFYHFIRPHLTLLSHLISSQIAVAEL
ncbi:hypothetical protein ACE34V_004802 [Vibrio alginolyticus]